MAAVALRESENYSPKWKLAVDSTDVLYAKCVCICVMLGGKRTKSYFYYGVTEKRGEGIDRQAQ